MADRVVQSYHGRDEKDVLEKSLKPYQSVWMAHWTKTTTSCSKRKANEAQIQSGHDSSREASYGSKQQHPLVSEPEMEAESCKLVTGQRDVNKGKTIDFMNDDDDSVMRSSKKLRNEHSCFPMFKLSQDRESVIAPRNGESSGQDGGGGARSSVIGHSSGYDVCVGRDENRSHSRLAPALDDSETQSREFRFRMEDLKWNLEHQSKSARLLENNRIAVSTSLQDGFLRSTSEILPYEFDSGRTSIKSLFSRQDQINEPGSTSFVHDEKKMSSNADLVFHDPSTSSCHLRDFFGKSIQKMPNRSDFELFSSQNRETRELQRTYQGSYAPPRLPSTLYDVETMRIRTTIDSIEEFATGPSKFSQTTHRFLIAKKTDLNLSNGGGMFRESAKSTECKGKMVNELFPLSPDLGFHVKQGVKLQPLDSSTESEGKENIENAKICITNEVGDSSTDGKANIEYVKTSAANANDSTAETDSMDMDVFCMNRLSGMASSPSNKDINKGRKSPASLAGMPSVRQEAEGRKSDTELPDINQKLAVLPGMASSADDRDTSPSRTQSLDVECFLPHAEQPPVNSNSSARPDAPLRLDPCSRWIIRLKPSTSDPFAYDTKSSKMEEPSSHKFNKSFSKVLKHSKTSSEQKIGTSHGREQMAADQTAESLRNASFSPNSVRKSQEITLSHSWIQRWCCNPSASAKKMSETLVVSEPGSSKATIDSQERQFPSIAAMALMGKAMTGFSPCEFRKTGPLVVWNTKGFGGKFS